MNFGESISSCFKKYATFEGRASRSEFWYFILAYNLFSIFIAIVEVNIGLVEADNIFYVWTGSEIGALSTLFLIFILIPSISVTSRRLQDRGISGWWQLSYFTIIGIFIIPILCILEAKEDENKWGRNPLLEQ